MKKQVLNTLLVLLTVAAFSVTSCKKSDDSKSRNEIITSGAWNLSQIGPDANNNGILDVGETVPNTTAGLTVHVNFYNNSTYQLVRNTSTVADTFNGNWSLTNGDQTIRVIVNGDTTMLDIHNIDNNNLTLLQQDSINLWEVFQQ